MGYFGIDNFSAKRALRKEWSSETTWKIDSQLSQIVEGYNCKEFYVNRAEERMNFAPDKDWCLQQIINELEYYEAPIYRKAVVGFYEIIEVKCEPEEWPIDYLAYQFVKHGLDPILEDFAHCIMEKDEGTSEWNLRELFIDLSIDKIANGASKAYALPILKVWLADKVAPSSETKNISPNGKLKWLGTPSQFGFIFQELIGKGFLQPPATSYKKMADAFLEHFEIETTSPSLSKELSTNETSGNSLSSNNRSKFKIPNLNQLK